jgi:hypothetical protein
MAVTISPPSSLGPLHCDKLSMTLSLKSGEREFVTQKLDSLLSKYYAKKAYSPLYRKSLKIGIGSHNLETLLVQANPKNKTASYLRVEYNPSKNVMQDVRDFLDEIIPAGGYGRLIEHGICTRIDVAVDINHAEVDRLLVIHPGLLTTKNYYSRGRLQTLYLGAKAGKRRVCIYDKVAQIKQSNAKSKIKQEIPNHPVTRIEVRSLKRIAAKELHKLENLFAKVEVSRVKYSMIRGNLFKSFWLAAQTVGPQTALLKLPSPLRDKLIKRLKLGALPCWMPEHFWQEWKHLSEEIKYPQSGGVHLGL